MLLFQVFISDFFSGSATTVAFKRSLIEGQNITEEEAQQIIKIISDLVESANRK